MKKTLLATFITLTALPIFAHPGPHPHPHPGPGPHPRQCQVVAIDQYNRIIAYFSGNAPMCQDGFNRCNNTIRRQGWWGARCVQMNNRW
jgi:hypothetical protein